MNLKRKFLSAALAVMCAVNVSAFNVGDFGVNAVSYSSEMLYDNSLTYCHADENDDGSYDSVSIVDYDKSLTELVIPDEIDGLPVKSVDVEATVEYNKLVSVTLGANVESINFDMLVYSSPELAEINVSENNKAFSSDNGIMFSKEKTELLMYPKKKSDLTEYVIPNSVNKIRKHAFYGCEALTDITISENVTAIEDYTFYACKSLTDIVIPDKVETIGENAFANCIKLATLKFGKSVTTIGRKAFDACYNLYDIDFSENITTVGGFAFANTYWLEQEMAKNPMVVVNDILINGQNCEGDVVIPDNVKYIADDAFNYADITSMYISESVISIPEYMFLSCKEVNNITVSEKNSKYSSIDGILFNKDKTVLIRYPQSKTGTEYVIPESVTEISGRAFESCSTLEKIDVPNSVNTIGSLAFCGCKALKNIVVPEKVTVICQSMFNGCDSLESVLLPDGLIKIENHAFSRCSKLSVLDIPDTVTEIGTHAFYESEALISANIPGGVKLIDAYTFSRCSSLAEITINNPECVIEDSASTISNKIDDFGNAEFTGIIYGYKDSTAQAYAEKYGYTFESLGEAAVTTTAMTTSASTTTTTTKTTVSTTVSTTVAAEDDNTLRGDANLDGKVNVRDCAFIASALALGNADKLPENADYNEDDKVNVRDAAAIASYLATAEN